MTKKDKKRVYEQGLEAKNNGYEKISPYQNCKAKIYWLAGFDGLDLDSI